MHTQITVISFLPALVFNPSSHDIFFVFITPLILYHLTSYLLYPSYLQHSPAPLFLFSLQSCPYLLIVYTILQFRPKDPCTTTIHAWTKIHTSVFPSWFNTSLSHADTPNIQSYIRNMSSSFPPFLLVFWFDLVNLSSRIVYFPSSSFPSRQVIGYLLKTPSRASWWQKWSIAATSCLHGSGW